MLGLDQRNSFTDEQGNHVDDEFVDLLVIEELRDDLAASDQPDMLTLRPAEAFRETRDIFVDKLDMGRVVLLRTPGEDVVFLSGVSTWPILTPIS